MGFYTILNVTEFWCARRQLYILILLLLKDIDILSTIVLWSLAGQLQQGIPMQYLHEHWYSLQINVLGSSLGTNQGQLQEWTEHSTLIFENLKPVEVSKIFFNII